MKQDCVAKPHSQFLRVPGDDTTQPELVRDYVESLKRPLSRTINLEGMRIVLDLAWGISRFGTAVFREGDLLA